MTFSFHSHPHFSDKKHLTGFPKFMSVLEDNFKNFYLANLLTVAGFLPFGIGVLAAVLSSSVLVLIPGCVIGGLFAGPALSCMYDTVLRGLRNASGDFLPTWIRAWKLNWKQSLLPGILFCLMLGFYIFMLMLFWWSGRFPHFLTLAVYLTGLLLFTMFFSVCWPQIALFEQPFTQCARNCLLFFLRFFPKTAGTALLQLLYWAVLALFLPWSAVLLFLSGFWFILYASCFLIYDTLNESFQIEQQIADTFPEQAPFHKNHSSYHK